jgi:hypothetical protein
MFLYYFDTLMIKIIILKKYIYFNIFLKKKQDSVKNLVDLTRPSEELSYFFNKNIIVLFY